MGIAIFAVRAAVTSNTHSETQPNRTLTPREYGIPYRFPTSRTMDEERETAKKQLEARQRELRESLNPHKGSPSKIRAPGLAPSQYTEDTPEQKTDPIKTKREELRENIQNLITPEEIKAIKEYDKGPKTGPQPPNYRLYHIIMDDKTPARPPTPADGPLPAPPEPRRAREQP